MPAYLTERTDYSSRFSDSEGRIVVVENVVVSFVAIGGDWARKLLEVVHDRRHAGLAQIGAIDVASAAGSVAGLIVTGT